MIFKTYNTNLDGISNKLGFNKRSFAEWSTQVSQAFNNAGKGLNGFKAALSSAFTNKTSNIQLINQSDFSNVFNTKNSQSFFNNFNTNATKSSEVLEKWCNGLRVTDKTMRSYLTHCMQNQIPASFEGYNNYVQSAIANNNQLSLSTKAAAFGFKALSMAGNMLAFMAISKVIQIAVEKISELSNASKIAEEKAVGFADSVNTAAKGLSDNASTLSSLNSEYQHLSKGVNALGENVSLSASEYARYKEIIQQVSDIMPDMTTYFNSQGEAIAFATGHLSDLSSEYEAYIQRQAKDFLIKGDGDGNTFQDTLNNFGNNSKMGLWETLKNTVKNSFFSYDASDVPVNTLISTLEQMQNKPKEEVLSYLTDVELDPNASFIQPESYRVRQIAQDILGVSLAEIRELESEEYNEFQKSIASHIEILQNSNEVDMRAITSGLLQSAYSKDDFWKMDENLRNDVTLMLSSISADAWRSINITDQLDAEAYVGRIINDISSGKSELADAWNGLFLLDDSTNAAAYTQDVQRYIDTICDSLEIEGEDNRREFALSLGFETDSTTLINNVKEKLQDEFDDNVGELSIEELKIAAEEIEVDDGTLLSWDQLLAKIKEVQDSKFDLEDFLAEDFSNTVSEITSAYSTLSSAIEEYNANGAYSLNTVTSLLSLKPEYLALLTEENGQLALNEQGLRSIIEAQLQEAQAKIYGAGVAKLKALADESAGTTSENAASRMAASSSDIAAQTQAYEENTAAALTNAASKAMEKGADQKDVDAIVKETENQVNAIQAAVNGLTFDVGGVTGGFSKAGSSASNAAKSSMEDIQKSWKEHLDQCLELYQAELDAGLIDFETFLSKSNAMIEEYYRDGKISAKEYYDYVGKMLETQKGIYDKVLSAVTKRFDREIDRIQDSIDAIEKQNEALEKQKDEYDTILSVVDSVYEKQIEHIQSQQDAIQDTIDALQEENDVRKFALQLEQAKWELYQAQTQRTRKIFNGTEFVYDTDKDAIRDAQENLADLTFEQTVDGLEKEKDALDAVIEELEYYRSIWNEISSAREKSENEQLAIALWGENYENLILSNRLSDIESFKDNYLSKQQQINDNQTLIDSYNEKIEYYEALKESWNSITDAYETSMNEQLAAQVLGADWESQILSGRLETLQQFRDEYIAIQQSIIDFAWQAANSVLAAQNAANTVGTSTGNAGNPPNQEEEKSGSIRPRTISQNATWYDPVTKKSGTGEPPEHLRNVMMAYGQGTDDAKEGYHLIAETGTEIIRDNYGNAVIAKGKQLHHFDGGETVFSPSETKELLSGELKPLDPASADIAPTLRTQSDVLLEQWQKIVPASHMPIAPICSMSRIPKYLDLPVSRDNSVTVSIGDIHLHEVQKVNTLARDIVLELPKKVMQELGKRRV